MECVRRNVYELGIVPNYPGDKLTIVDNIIRLNDAHVMKIMNWVVA